MIVRNRKTLKEYEITENDWQKLVAAKTHRLFEIVKKDNVVKGKTTIPKEVVEFQTDVSKLKIIKEKEKK